MPWVAVVGFVVFILVVYWQVEASRRLLTMQIDRGRVVRIEGRAPSGAVGDLRDVFERHRSTGTIFVRLEAGRAVAHVSESIEANAAQQVRNVVGRFAVAQWKAGRSVKS